MPMKRELRDGWCSDLRSGNFPQTFGALRNASGYCCLGVLGERLGKMNEQCSEYYGWQSKIWDWGGAHVCPPVKDTEAAGLPTSAVEELMRMNDGSVQHPSKTFPEIADWIEANIPVTE